MITVANELFKKLESELSEILEREDAIIEQTEKCINVIIDTLKILKDAVIENPFENMHDEILFFKEIKPKFICKLIYNLEVLGIETKKPVGSYKTQRKYFLRKLNRICQFFNDNQDFYQYYRTGATHLDEKYFLRKQFNIRLFPEPYVFDHDPQFSTSHDFKVSRILANEMLIVHLNSSLAALEQQQHIVSKVVDVTTKKLKWTASKTALIEMVYGLYAAGVFNHSNADVKQIANFLGSIFNVDLGNYYRTFQEIRIRKSGRTNFIDQMKKRLIQKMDESDENPK